MNTIKIITSTTREGRKGIAIANWITDLAKQNNRYNIELLDLAQINLPFMDEPNHPRLKQYHYEHTKKWSETINTADAFIIVLAEYNFGFPAPIKNAIDYLYNEWMNKPVAFVSYGGVSGGLRATQMLKQVVSAVHMMPVTDQVNIPFFAKLIDDNGVFQPGEPIIKSAEAMLKGLESWSEALKTMRNK
ncbi:NADPH-dependent FMN reductase [Niastella yeongjuensis]|uniref:NADPH-dependent FMN reductase n=1 Tax=Niastella yeongjuensis TaxID=354355 RepID=A0A1V9E4S1_9BACT|nr:NAD(P)H-dependent oxidoreductase [Niastella yeongjuensis]OQP41096.1 NADPH-dependent FMN reductase [Niastella yeongjuensis]SEO92293.1 NAD(P)H-dependent FMN reductase [Niastella yeongjuensis]